MSCFKKKKKNLKVGLRCHSVVKKKNSPHSTLNEKENFDDFTLLLLAKPTNCQQKEFEQKKI